MLATFRFLFCLVSYRTMLYNTMWRSQCNLESIASLTLISPCLEILLSVYQQLINWYIRAPLGICIIIFRGKHWEVFLLVGIFSCRRIYLFVQNVCAVCRSRTSFWSSFLQNYLHGKKTYVESLLFPDKRSKNIIIIIIIN